MSTVISVPLDQLAPHPDNSKFFQDIEGEYWEFFRADIDRNGVLQPLLVTKDNNGTYTVLSGHQRLRAAKALDFESVPCILITPEVPRDVLYSTNLGRQLTTIERYRLTIHLLDQMDDRRKTRERGENGQFHHLAENRPNGQNRINPLEGTGKEDENGQFHHSVHVAQNGDYPRDQVVSMVPGVTNHDITLFRRIRELPQPVQAELFKFVEKENPNKRALRVKVNALNDEKRRLKAALREERKLKMKKKEMEQLEEFVQTEVDPKSKYDAKCFDEIITAVNRAVVEIPRLIADVLSFSPLSARTAEILDHSISALSKVLHEQGRLLLARWEKHKPPAEEDEPALEADI